MTERVCYYCLETKKGFFDETKQWTCHDCFGRKHSKRRPKKTDERTPTFKELKDKLEKNW